MAKKVVGYIKLQVKAGQANPSPPVGPALGQRGLNIMEFCKAFNAATQKLEPGLPVPVIITAYSDRTFTFITKSTPATTLLKKAAGISSGSKRPNTEKVGKVTRKQLEEIAMALPVALYRIETYPAGLRPEQARYVFVSPRVQAILGVSAEELWPRHANLE